MGAKKKEVKYFNTKEIKEELNLSESAFRKILSSYLIYIPHRKGLKNANLFSLSSVRIIESINNQKKMRYTKEEIIQNLKTHPNVLKAKLENGETSETTDTNDLKNELVELVSQPDYKSLVGEFVSRIKKQESEIRSLGKSLDKRTLQYQEEMTTIKQEQANKLIDLQEHLSRVRQELDEVRKEQSKTLFQKFISFLNHPVF